MSAYFDVAGDARNVLVVAAEGGGTAARILLSACVAGRTVTCNLLGPGGGVLDLGHQLTGMSSAAMVQLHKSSMKLHMPTWPYLMGWLLRAAMAHGSSLLMVLLACGCTFP